MSIFYCIYVSASWCKTNACSCNKAQWDVANFAEIYRNWLREQWNQLHSDESDNDDSEDESDTDDECQYESSDVE